MTNRTQEDLVSLIFLSWQIMRDPDTGHSRGFGFVSFDSFDASDAGLDFNLRCHVKCLTVAKSDRIYEWAILVQSTNYSELCIQERYKRRKTWNASRKVEFAN